MRMVGQVKEWIQEPHEVLDDGLISADAISDLRTEDNCISTWYVGDKSTEEIKKGVLALTSGFKSLEEIKIVFLDDAILRSAGLTICETDGDTKIKDYVKLHRDIALLNSAKLQKLAKIILENVWEENTQVIPRDTIIKWLLSALNEKLLCFDALEKNVKVAFASSINKMIRQNKVNKEDIDEDVWADIEKQLKKNLLKTNCPFEEQCERYQKIS